MPERYCNRCHRPRSGSSSGSITQWVSVCACDQLGLQGESLRICAGCGKRVDPGRPGSITQYVFRSDLCGCRRPEPILDERQADGAETPSGFGGELSEEPELDIDPEFFPAQRYRVLGEIGRGTSGTVYLCRDRLLGKKVAVKVLEVLTAEQLVAFQEEARVTSSLNHPGIIKILDFGATDGGVPYMVLEYFPGSTLRTIIDDGEPLSMETIASTFAKIAGALAGAHESRIFHRDLKPSNVLIAGLDTRLIDFGIARVSEITGRTTQYQGRTLAGTPFYMSPDVARGLPYTERSDIYSLGCMLYECLTGRVPYRAESALDTIAMHAAEPLPELLPASSSGPAIPSSLAEIVRSCLAKDPEQRPESAAVLSRRLEESLEDISSEHSSPAEAIRGSSPRKLRKEVLVLALTALVVAGAASFVVSRVLTEGSSVPPRSASHSGVPEVVPHNAFADIASARMVEHENALGEKVITIQEGSDPDLKAIAARRKKIGRLEILSFRGILGGGLRHLLNAPVAILTIRDSMLSEEGIGYLSRMNVKDLRLSFQAFDKDSLSLIVSNPSIEGLEISDATLPEGALPAIAGARSMRNLVLLNCVLKDKPASFGSLKKNSSLRVLSISDIPLSPEDLREIAGLRSLHTLMLQRVGLTDFSIGIISGMKVTTLGLEFPIGDAGVKKLSVMPVHQLILHRPEFTEKGYEILAGMPDLRVLKIINPPFSLRGTSAFMKARPDCRLLLR